MRNRQFALTAGILAFALIIAPAAQACIEMDICARYPWLCGVEDENISNAGQQLHVTLSALPGNGALIEISGWALAAMEGDFECVTVLPRLPEIDQVRGVRVRNDFTSETAYSFIPSLAPQIDFAPIAKERWASAPDADHWLGFVAHIKGGFTEVSPATMIYRVTLKEGTTLTEFAHSLQRSGILGSGSARPDGRLDWHHWDLNHLGNIRMSIVIPPPRAGRGEKPAN
jgi:hypothetical protein